MMRICKRCSEVYKTEYKGSSFCESCKKINKKNAKARYKRKLEKMKANGEKRNYRFGL